MSVRLRRDKGDSVVAYVPDCGGRTVEDVKLTLNTRDAAILLPIINNPSV